MSRRLIARRYRLASLIFMKTRSIIGLFATVKWHTWFKPFAFIYTFVSRKMDKLICHYKSKKIEMTGDIYSIREDLDGRDNVRAWMRKIADDTAFVALYSTHENKGRSYMNIALPLPFSSMIGILELNQIGNELQLTSKKLVHLTSMRGFI